MCVDKDGSFKDNETFKEFLSDERSEIERYKWIESEKAGHDLGTGAIMDWIKKYAASYRSWWVDIHGDNKPK